MFPVSDISHKFGRVGAELQFSDTDGILVLVSLNLNEMDEPFEVDIWKTDLRPLVSMPAGFVE